MNRSAHKGAKFRCYDCKKDWVIPKNKLIYIRDWPTKCPDCGSTRIRYEGVGTVMASAGTLTSGIEKELKKMRRK